jgi:hypothetical protein
MPIENFRGTGSYCKFDILPGGDNKILHGDKYWKTTQCKPYAGFLVDDFIKALWMAGSRTKRATATWVWISVVPL